VRCRIRYLELEGLGFLLGVLFAASKLDVRQVLGVGGLTSGSLGRAAGTAIAASGPQFEGVSAPLENIYGALKVGSHGTRRSPSRARPPVSRVNLPQSDIERPVRVLVRSVRISAALVVGDALTAVLRPS